MGGGRVPTTLKEQTVEENFTSKVFYCQAAFHTGTYNLSAYPYSSDSDFFEGKTLKSVSSVRRYDGKISSVNSWTVTNGLLRINFSVVTDVSPSRLRFYVSGIVERKEEQLVFAVKLNGTEYNKIKLNGEIITPKA